MQCGVFALSNGICMHRPALHGMHVHVWLLVVAPEHQVACLLLAIHIQLSSGVCCRPSTHDLGIKYIHDN